MKALFHYTNSNSARQIIENQTLKFGNIAKTNDPLEMKNLLVQSILGIDAEELDITSVKYLESILNILCFAEGEFDIPIKLEHEGACELTLFTSRPMFFLPRMWALYGENGNGVCLVFDRDKILKRISDTLAVSHNTINKSVIYKDIIQGMELIHLDAEIAQYFNLDSLAEHKELGAVHQYLDELADRVYFIKDIDWQNEFEYRIVCWQKKKGGCVLPIFVDIHDCLVAIVLGMNSQLQLEVLDSFDLINVKKLKISYDIMLSVQKVM